MLNRKKALFFLSTAFFLISNSLLFAEETVTITTYYPSPYGVYNSLQTNMLGVGDNNNDGSLTSADVPTASGEAWIKGNVGIGTMSPSVKLDVNGGIRPGSSSLVTTCGSGAANGEGTQRYNYSTHVMEYCNGTEWARIGGGVSSQNEVTSSRAYSTVYQNTNSQPLFVFITAGCAFGQRVEAYTDSSSPPSTPVGYGGSAGGNYSVTYSSLFFIVLPNNYYQVINYGCGDVGIWMEWN